MTWSGGHPPTTGAQGSNLDNNNGPETYDGEDLTTYVQTAGTYTGPPGPAGTAVVGQEPDVGDGRRPRRAEVAQFNELRAGPGGDGVAPLPHVPSTATRVPRC